MLQAEDSETEDDEISAVKYIASREALTPVRQISHGHKWGRRMPSPFDTPTPAAETQQNEEQEDEEDLVEALSCASSDFDPSANPVCCCAA